LLSFCSEEPMTEGLFWLHILKSAGTSTRAALADLYVNTDRQSPPARITDLPPAAWNDALNNYRMTLGPYQFRRCLYASTELWPGTWDGMVRLAFARRPLDRTLSMFDYLFYPFDGRRRKDSYRRAALHCPNVGWRTRLPFTQAARFDLFLATLDWQAGLRGGPDPAAPINLHFSTHTAPMAPDVCDDAGRVLLSHLVRLEHFEAGIDLAYAAMGRPRPDSTRGIRRHTSRRPAPYAPSPAQVREVERLYAADYDLYENALRP
jgi:hypothetical protein